LQDHGYGGYNVSRGVLIYVLAFANTYCTHPQTGAQAELTWMAGYIAYRDGLSADGRPSKYRPSWALINFVDATKNVTN